MRNWFSITKNLNAIRICRKVKSKNYGFLTGTGAADTPNTSACRYLVYKARFSIKVLGTFYLLGLLALIFFFLFTFFFLFADLPTWPVISFAFFDCVLITYCAWNAVRMGFFSLHVIAMQAFIARGRVGELNGAITGAVQSCRIVAKTGGGNNKAAALQLKRAVAIFRREHRHLHEVAVTINDLVSSRLMIVTFLTNIFNNVMMIAKLIFEPLLPMEAAAVFLIILAQTTISLPACFVQITWAKALYSEASIHLLYVSQPMLTNDEQSGAKFGNNNGTAHQSKKSGLKKQASFGGVFQKRPTLGLGDGGLFGAVMLMEKLKLNLYFELVCTQSPFMFTLGQLGGISKKSLYEVLLFFALFTFCTRFYLALTVFSMIFMIVLTVFPRLQRFHHVR